MDPILQQMYDLASRRVCTPYQPNQARLLTIAEGLKLKPAARDKTRVLRLHVDVEPDFTWPFTWMTDEGEIRYVMFSGMEKLKVPPHMAPKIDWMRAADFDPTKYTQVWGGRLSVPNSWNSFLSELRCDYVNLHRTTQHAFSVDNHGRQSVFDTHHYRARRRGRYNGPVAQFSYEVGDHPQPFTILAPDDIYHEVKNKSGVWQPVGPSEDADWTYTYVTQLYESQSGKDPLDVMPHMLWTIHCTRQTFGGSVDPLLWEMALLHGYARQVDWILFLKGLSWATEMFGIFAPQVPVPGDPHGQVNLAGLQLHEQFDIVAVSGQARGNCLRRTDEQKFNYIVDHAPDQAGKMIDLIDTSDYIPGTEVGAERSFAEMRKKGLRTMTTDEYTAYLDQIGA